MKCSIIIGTAFLIGITFVVQARNGERIINDHIEVSDSASGLGVDIDQQTVMDDIWLELFLAMLTNDVTRAANVLTLYPDDADWIVGDCGDFRDFILAEAARVEHVEIIEVLLPWDVFTQNTLQFVFAFAQERGLDDIATDIAQRLGIVGVVYLSEHHF